MQLELYLSLDLIILHQHPLGGRWRLESRLPPPTTALVVNTYPPDPFQPWPEGRCPAELPQICAEGVDQPAAPTCACRLQGRLEAEVSGFEDEDTFVLPGRLGGAFAAGDTLTVTVTAAPGSALQIELRAFRARLPLVRDDRGDLGVWTVAYTVPPEYDGRYLALHVSTDDFSATATAYSAQLQLR